MSFYCIRSVGQQTTNIWKRLIREAHSPAQLRAIFRRLCYKHPHPATSLASSNSHQTTTAVSRVNDDVELYAMVQEVHKSLRIKTPLTIYKLLLTAILNEIRKNGLWPDYECYAIIVAAQAASGSLSTALTTANTASQQLARRLYIKHGLQGALWLGVGLYGIKWIDIPSTQCTTTIDAMVGTCAIALSLMVRSAIGIWIKTPMPMLEVDTLGVADATDHRPAKQSGDYQVTQSSSLLLLTRRDIEEHLQMLAAKSLVQSWDIPATRRQFWHDLPRIALASTSHQRGHLPFELIDHGRWQAVHTLTNKMNCSTVNWPLLDEKQTCQLGKHD
ncbi:hypothetical protein BDF22DRAFT_666803 [Syncephalis plumigaleata]|nr:hypothetical protein BDF22DRAFT_666803 [Syncephalis plumigaleata]